MENKRLLAILLLSASAVISVVESSFCPDKETIEPCFCVEEDRVSNVTCSQIPNVEALKKFLQNSDGYNFEEVTLKDSSLPYVPKEFLEKIKAKSFVMSNLQLIRLFDSIPKSNSIPNITIESIKVQSAFSWIYFNLTVGLENLYVRKTPIPVLDVQFNQFVPKTLQVLELRETGTKMIQKGAFRDFKNLDSIAVIYNDLEQIDRETLPVPYKGAYLLFQYNKLTAVRDDFFTLIQNVKYVDFRGNSIRRVPNPILEGGDLSIKVNLKDNPLSCDCTLKWIVVGDVKNKLIGSCAAPRPLVGKSLDALTAQDFSVCDR